MTGQCELWLKNVKLYDSHIVPEFAYKNVYIYLIVNNRIHQHSIFFHYRCLHHNPDA